MFYEDSTENITNFKLYYFKKFAQQKISIFTKKNKYKTPQIFNSDQGSQYTSNKVIGLLAKHDISISMDALGRCYDNIFMERFRRTLKQENVYPERYEIMNQARILLKST